MKNSVRKEIRIANENEGSPIEKPEEIIVFDNLQRAGSTPTIVNDIIKYEARELAKEERYRDSRKQSLLDNPRMLYFYESSGRYYHDRDCLEVKQIGVCDKILRDHGVSLGKIKHCVMEVGMKFHATSMEELLVEGVEDTWIVKGLCNKNLVLWHNNYVKTEPTERYITEGFHKQKVDNKSLTQLLTYIEKYSFIKHLEKEQQTAESLDITVIDNDKQETAPEIKTPERVSKADILKGFINKLKKIFNI